MSNMASPSSRRHPEVQGDPFAACLTGFNAWLVEQGYTRNTRRVKIRLITKLGYWLDVRDLALAALDEEHMASFLQKQGGKVPGAVATGRQLLSWLRANNAIDADHPAPGRDDGPVVQVVSRYERFLIDERGLSAVTIKHYREVIHTFLVDRFPAHAVELDSLTIEDINEFVCQYHQKVSFGRIKVMVSALRGFCRYLFRCGDIDTDIASAIISVPNWRLSSLPRPLTPQQLDALLDSCDRSTGIGRRDHAILLLLAHLGLRACEVVRLSLDDVDWNRGLITVSGKGSCRDYLPLTDSVGEALAAWLLDGRPTPCATRRMFVGKYAPHRGFASSTAIGGIVRRAMVRAGVKPSGGGAAHLLRHTLASGMLHNGASLEEIGQVLRHGNPDSTRIYAKVDVVALRTLAPVWPGTAS